MDINRLEQIVIEDRQSRKNIREKIINDIKNSDLEEIFNKAEVEILKYLAKDYYESKNKRINKIKLNYSQIVAEIFILTIGVNTTFQAIAGQLANILEYEDIFDGIKTASELLAIVCNTDLYDITRTKDTLMIKSNYLLDKSTMDFIERTKYLNPMLCKPERWTNNTNGGYITIRNSIVLGNSHHNKHQSYDVVNKLQNIAFSLDERILAIQEESTKPLDTKEKRENWTKLVNGSNETYQELLDSGNQFYFVWRYDKRGRAYSSGYYVNIQSTSYKKALMNFSKKEIVK